MEKRKGKKSASGGFAPSNKGLEISPQSMETIYASMIPDFTGLRLDVRAFLLRMFQKGCGAQMKEALTDDPPLSHLLFTYEEVAAEACASPVRKKRKLFEEEATSKAKRTPPEKRPNFLRGSDGKKLVMPKLEKEEAVGESEGCKTTNLADDDSDFVMF